MVRYPLPLDCVRRWRLRDIMGTERERIPALKQLLREPRALTSAQDDVLFALCGSGVDYTEWKRDVAERRLQLKAMKWLNTIVRHSERVVGRTDHALPTQLADLFNGAKTQTHLLARSYYWQEAEPDVKRFIFSLIYHGLTADAHTMVAEAGAELCVSSARRHRWSHLERCDAAYDWLRECSDSIRGRRDLFVETVYEQSEQRERRTRAKRRKGDTQMVPRAFLLHTLATYEPCRDAGSVTLHDLGRRRALHLLAFLADLFALQLTENYQVPRFLSLYDNSSSI